jgi:hypothetical protein
MLVVLNSGAVHDTMKVNSSGRKSFVYVSLASQSECNYKFSEKARDLHKFESLICDGLFMDNILCVFSSSYRRELNPNTHAFAD